MMHGFQQIITEAECRYNFVVHGLPPRGDEMAVSPLSWRKKLMDSISGNLGYYYKTYPTFDVLGTQFAMARSKAHENLHKLSPILYDTLVHLELMPYRELTTPEALKAALPGVDRLL